MELYPFDRETRRLKLAGLCNKTGREILDSNSSAEDRVVVALHGWLDNAASFVPLLSAVDTTTPVYALELPGHGKSDHRPSAVSYHMAENILDVLAFIDEVSPGKSVDLIGHSLGGIICSLVAAAAPERIHKLVMLDSLGPYTDATTQVLPQLRKAVERASRLQSSKLTVYPSLDKAIAVRRLGVGKITEEAASLLVDRGVKEVEGGYSWSSDPKLMEPSLIRFSEEQVKAVYEGIECPVLLICGDAGYFSDYRALEKRLSYIANLQKTMVTGGHHFHMEGDVVKTAGLINEFLEFK